MNSSIFRRISMKKEKEKSSMLNDVNTNPAVTEEPDSEQVDVTARPNHPATTPQDNGSRANPNRVSVQDPAESTTPSGSPPKHQQEEDEVAKERRRRSIKRSQSKKIVVASTCPQCLNEFKSPKTLPCDHTFCQECIRPFINPKNLVSCPVCQREYPIPQGDPETLSVNPQILRLLEKAKTAKVELGLDKKREESGHRRHHANHHNHAESPHGAAVLSCNICHVDLKSDNRSQFCLHCQKVYCSLDFETHAKLVKEHLTSMTDKLKDCKPKLDEIRTSIDSKLRVVTDQADSLLNEKISKLKREREGLSKQIEEKRSSEGARVQKALDKIESLSKVNDNCTDQSSAQDIIKQFVEVQPDYQAVVSEIDDLSVTKYELAGDLFTLAEKKVAKGRRVSTMADQPGTSSRRGSGYNEVVAHGHTTKLSAIGRLKLAQAKKPFSIAFCPWNQYLFVTTPETKTVCVLDTHGKVIQTIESDNAYQLLLPVRVAFNELTKDALILDKWQHNIQVYSTKNSLYVNTLGSEGRHPGYLQGPCGIAVEPKEGSIIIADTGNDRVQVWTSSGKFLRLIGGSLEKDKSGKLVKTVSELNQPEDVRMGPDGNLVIVADTGNNRIRIYTLSGQQMTIIGMRGRGNGQFDLPLSVEIHPNAQMLLVGDSENNRIQAFSMSGQFLKAITGYRKVTSICAGPEYVYVVESGSNVIHLIQ